VKPVSELDSEVAAFAAETGSKPSTAASAMPRANALFRVMLVVPLYVRKGGSRPAIASGLPLQSSETRRGNACAPKRAADRETARNNFGSEILLEYL
jgi:hypothetical protein